jgi:similar to stage IV sporulation protein
MKQAVNYFRGSVRVSVECPYPERLVNVCAANDIEFWDLQRQSATEVHISVHIGGFRKLRNLAYGAGFEIKEVKKKGVPFTLWKLRRRYVLLAGMAVMFLAVWGMSLFIWEIDVVGNDRVPSSRILEELEKHGVGIGTFGPSVVSEAISNELILELPDLAWIAVNVTGSHAAVLVRERIPKPDILDENLPMMVCAVKPGIISKMSVLEGEYASRPGDTVEPGDVLVTGIMNSIASGKRTVHAMAEVYARTWYDLSAQMTLDMAQKSYTGEKQVKRAVIIAGNRINFYFNGGISFLHYDKMTSENALRLPTGNVLPLTFVTEEYKEYKETPAQMPLLDAQKILQQRLMDRLRLAIGTGEVVTTDYETSVKNGVITVTLHAECLEQIAKERPFTPEELVQAATPEAPKEQP